MPKSVGTVQHSHSPAECGAVLPSLQQVPQEGLAGWNQFVTQDVPWADLEVALGHRTRDPLSPIRPNRQRIFQDDRLPVEDESCVGIAFEQLQQIPGCRDEPRLECGTRQVPLTIPVCVQDKVESRLLRHL